MVFANQQCLACGQKGDPRLMEDKVRKEFLLSNFFFHPFFLPTTNFHISTSLICVHSLFYTMAVLWPSLFELLHVARFGKMPWEVLCENCWAKIIESKAPGLSESKPPSELLQAQPIIQFQKVKIVFKMPELWRQHKVHQLTTIAWQKKTDLYFLKVPSGEATWAHWEAETTILKTTGSRFPIYCLFKII